MTNRTMALAAVATCMGCTVLVAGTIAANADTRHDDIAASAAAKFNASIMLALNPKRSPPKCPPPGCNHHKQQQKRTTHH